MFLKVTGKPKHVFNPVSAKHSNPVSNMLFEQGFCWFKSVVPRFIWANKDTKTPLAEVKKLACVLHVAVWRRKKHGGWGRVKGGHQSYAINLAKDKHVNNLIFGRVVIS